MKEPLFFKARDISAHVLGIYVELNTIYYLLDSITIVLVY